MTPPSTLPSRPDDAPADVAAAAVAGPAATASSPGAALSIQGVTKRYTDQVAVDGVSIEIRAGEFVTFLGPSGSGKTTTLNMIAGFADLDEGAILLDGRSIAELPPHRRNVGMVFQNYALFPHMTAFENVAFPLRQRRVPKAEIARRVIEALELAHMAPYAKRYPRELSGGQQQRVAVARAIVFNPRVLLMDEPLGALDKKLRESIQGEIRRIHRELGITFIYVTHDQEEALVLSDRIAIFDQGRIVQVGSAEELYEQPANVFVADFIGDSNLLTGRLRRRDGVDSLERDGLRWRILGAEARPEGAELTVVVRPERLRVSPRDTVPPEGANAVSGTLDEVIYLGDALRFVVKVPGAHADVVVRTPLTAGAARTLAPGDEVLVTWPFEAGVLVD
jgi:putative spermidine/putrescine transport system ATP-binding protein